MLLRARHCGTIRKAKHAVKLKAEAKVTGQILKDLAKDI